MRKLYILAFLGLLAGLLMSLTALFIPGASDTMGGFFGGILGGGTEVITSSVVGLMAWGAADFVNSSVVLVGTIFLTAVTWIILTRALWPRIKNIRGTPAPAPAPFQAQPSTSIQMQSQPEPVKKALVVPPEEATE